MLLAERQAYRVELRDQALLIEKLKHRIAKLQHERFGQSSERRALLDQLELQLFALEEDQSQAETAEEIAGPPRVTVETFERRKPARRPLPEHLPRERVVHGTFALRPSLGVKEHCVLISAQDWWDHLVCCLPDGAGVLSRKDIVLTAANKDGGRMSIWTCRQDM